MSKTPTKNPNYWFNDYQQEGDKFNIPRPEIFHRPAWEKLSILAKEANIEIVNCSPGTTLDCFKVSKLKDELF